MVIISGVPIFRIFTVFQISTVEILTKMLTIDVITVVLKNWALQCYNRSEFH